MTDCSVEDLERLWNAQPDPMNTWDELGLDEIVVFAQQVARQWRPIESAPRNGTFFIGISIGGEVVNVGWTRGEYGGCSGPNKPTHWMPLTGATAMTNRIYIAGPMSGLPDYNYPAFNDAAEKLRSYGLHVENPAEGPPQDSWQDYMRQAITQMLACDEVVMLPGWMDSEGAMLERDIAARIGMRYRMMEDYLHMLESTK